MAMPMQISLEEVITMLLSRVEGLAASDENDKTRSNIILRVLCKKGIITEEDIKDSIREEHRMLKELGLVDELPGDDVVDTLSKGILQWAMGDVTGIKSAMEQYERRVRELQEEQQRRSNLTVASADALNQLGRIAPPPGGKGGSKLII